MFVHIFGKEPCLESSTQPSLAIYRAHDRPPAGQGQLEALWVSRLCPTPLLLVRAGPPCFVLVSKPALNLKKGSSLAHPPTPFSFCPFLPCGCPVETAASGRKSGRVHGPNRIHLPRNPLRVNPFGEHDGCRPLQHRAQVRATAPAIERMDRGCPQPRGQLLCFDTSPSVISRTFVEPSKMFFEYF